MHNDTSTDCGGAASDTKPRPLNIDVASEMLHTLRPDVISYPVGYFRGRGIVLSVGPSQISFAKVNLKMIEHTGTQLPVQVDALLYEEQPNDHPCILDLVFFRRN